MNIYEKAIQSIKNNELAAKLFSGNRKHVFLNRSNGNLFLVYQERDTHNLVRRTEQTKCAVYMPNRGWIFSLDRDTYASWVKRTGHKAGATV